MENPTVSPGSHGRPVVSPASVTVVIPSYDYGHTIIEAIESALTQQGIGHEIAFLEVVVVDDGSNDGTGDLVASRFGDSVRYVYQSNRGLPAARNRGVDLALGDWTLFLDADDVLAPDHLIQMLDALRSNPEATFAYGDFRDFGASEGMRIMPEFDPERLKRGNYIGASTLYPTALLRRLRSDERMRTGYEDWDLALRFVAAGHRGVHAHVALGYRRHASSMSVGLTASRRARRRRWRLFARLYRNHWRFLGVGWPLRLVGRSVRSRLRR